MNKLLIYTKRAALVCLIGINSSCNDFLDINPDSFVTPENYLTESSQLASYTVNMYPWLQNLSTKSINGKPILREANTLTDDWVNQEYCIEMEKGEYFVPQSNEYDNDEWNFTQIYKVNYFLDVVLPRFENGEIQGNEADIRHYIGEAYFFRAYVYFQKLTRLGDFPIVTEALADDKDQLIEKSKRAPRNEVARFILSDLDKAIEYLKEIAPDGGRRNLLSKPVAQLLKSRVALYEGSWLKNFANTAFVPGGPSWPGASKDYNKDYEYKSGSIESEISFFLGEAMKSAKVVADATSLTVNSKVIPSELTPNNDYFMMFCDQDMSSYSEILLWKEYSASLGLTHYIVNQLQGEGSNSGMTHELIMSFLGIDGLPHYASAYPVNENDIMTINDNRDYRLQLFSTKPKQQNFWKNTNVNGGILFALVPAVMNSTCPTGYLSRKGLNPDKIHSIGGKAYTGAPIFRAAEAHLNYIEASYLLNGRIDSDADTYWRALRDRAGVDNDYNKTINALEMEKEADFDWAAYTAGQLISPTEMAIRKERRAEFMMEGRRYDDLRRWRSLDQLITRPHRLRGMVVWEGENKAMFEKETYLDTGKTYASYFKYDRNSNKSVISEPSLGKYVYPHSIKDGPGFEGETWQMAHYLYPIAITHFQVASHSGDISDSPIYQNPHWPAQAGGTATE